MNVLKIIGEVKIILGDFKKPRKKQFFEKADFNFTKKIFREKKYFYFQEIIFVFQVMMVMSLFEVIVKEVVVDLNV